MSLARRIMALVGGATLVGSLGMAGITPAGAATRTSSGTRVLAPKAVAPRPEGQRPPLVRGPAPTVVAPAPAGGRSAFTAKALDAVRAKEKSIAHVAAPHLSISSATTFTVDSTADSPLATTDGTTCVDSETTPACSLRAAVEAANNLGTPVVIKLPAGTYTLDNGTSGNLGALVEENPGGTSIEGAGASTTAVAVYNGDSGVFQVTDASASAAGTTMWLSGVTVTGGDATYGGGIDEVYGNDAVVLNHDAITANTASYGGGIDCSYGASSEEGGSLWVSNTTMKQNTATDDGGALAEYWCNVQLTNVAANSDTATDGGAGLYEEYGSVSVTGGSVSYDTTAGTTSGLGYGGGIVNYYALSDLTGVSVNYDKAESSSGSGWGGGYYTEYGQVDMTGGSLSHDQALGTDSVGGGLATDDGAQVALHGVQVTYDSTGATSSEYGGGGIYLYNDEGEAATSLLIDGQSSVSDDSTGGINIYNEYGGGTVDIASSTLSDDTSLLDYTGGALSEYYDSNYYGGYAVTLTGDTIDSNSDTGAYSAGAIMTSAYDSGSDLTLENDSIENNSTTSDGAGAVIVWAYEYAMADLHMTGDTVEHNSAAGSGGAGAVEGYSEYYGNVAMDISSSTLSYNRAPDGGYGGAILAYDEDDYSPIEVNLTNDVVSHNWAGSTATGEQGYGGALNLYQSATADIVDTTMAGNRAFGTSATGGEGGAVYSYYQSASYTGDTIRGNKATGYESEGGGVWTENYYPGSYFLQSTIANNDAQYGAGIFSEDYAERLVDSTVSGNVAGSLSTVGEGGGLYLEDTALLATNSTIADNVALGSTGEGGGIFQYSEPAMTFENSTISGNAAATGGGLYGDAVGGSFLGSIVSGNTTTLGGSTESDCAYDAPESDLTSAGDNVIGQSGCVTGLGEGDVVTTNPGLKALANYGGPTETMALLRSSPARNRLTGPCPATDERGQPRPSAKCDAGAYQFALGAIASIKRSSGEPGSDVTLTGSGFTFATEVTFGSKLAHFTVESDSKIVAVVPKGYDRRTKVSVAVYTPDGHGRIATFKYT